MTHRRIGHDPYDVELAHGYDHNIELTRVGRHAVGALHAQCLRFESAE